MADNDPTSSAPRVSGRAERRVARLFDVGDRDREELRACGRHLRSRTPRSSHAVWKAPTDRPVIVDLLSDRHEVLLAGLLPLRYGRLLRSPLAFFRGTPDLMAADLARTPSIDVYVQACGDAHLMNFGVFTSRVRESVCDLIDFDQTQPAPWEWDVKRLAVSFVLAADEAGLPAEEARAAAEAAVRHYRGTVAALSTETSLGIHRGHLRVDDILTSLSAGKRETGRGGKATGHPPARTQVLSFERLAVAAGSRLAIAGDPPLVLPLDDAEKPAVARVVDDYGRSLSTDMQHVLAQYRFVDAARLLTGESDVGLPTVLVLLQGRGDPDPLFLQVRPAVASVLAPYAGHTDYARHGQRLVAGQRLTQAVSDPLLGWLRAGDGDLYVRQVHDSRVAREPGTHPKWFSGWARLCGATLARAHARAVDPAVISGYLGGSDRFDTAVASFAETYADQVRRDHASLEEAVRSGRVTVRDEA